jgi:hypothetical protein
MNEQLATFSLISTQWQKYNKSYLDNFVPLFATLLINKKITSFKQKDYTILSDNFKQIFVLPPIPAYLISSLVSKLVKLNILTKERDLFMVNTQTIIENGLYIQNEIDTCINKQAQILDCFVLFCKNSYSKIFSREEAGHIVTTFINENYSDIFFEEKDLARKNHNEENFLVAKYISYLFVEHPDFYKDFVNFSVGKIAFNAMYFVPLESEKEPLKKCVFFLDSSFVFPLLGIDSMQRESIVKEIIQEIRFKGGFVKIYKHTYDEINQILETARRYIESPNYDPRLANKALSYLRQEGYSITKVDLIIKSIDRVLKDNHIDIEKNIIDKKLGIDENKLSEEISKNLSLRQFETADRYADRTERDVYSIIYTYERRKKIISKDFIDAKYSFITENALLTKADRNIIYEYTDKKIKRTDLFTAAIPEAMLCSYLYLGSSKKAVNNITMSVLATAYTAIRPTPELEALVKDIALKLKDDGRITEKEYHLVTSSYLIKDCLSEKTLCSYEKVNEDTIFSLIEDAKDAVGMEERKKRKEAEKQLFVERNKNLKRKTKAEKKAKRQAHILFILKLIGLCIPYIMSGISFFKISWMSSLVIFIIWTVFCFLINHFYPINLKIMWKNTYIKALTRAYEHFELDLGKDQI